MYHMLSMNIGGAKGTIIKASFVPWECMGPVISPNYRVMTALYCYLCVSVKIPIIPPFYHTELLR